MTHRTVTSVRPPRVSDVAIVAFVFAIATLLLIPVPTILLDILITANLGGAFMLLLVAIYMPNALSLLVFPSLLLLTTLFRLGLNVASARLILVQADAGRVIESFGLFLIRGEIAVGIIIFTIITIVNYIVVAKGSSRVSEVAARFVLDALPGKQESIDSDLRSGLISPEKAQALREELRKESQLFGAMDGAMKFVQGDAIAGIFIIFANMLGGMYIGVSRGMSVADASQTYLILTVGDGLVSQIPALLISITAGIIVTRVSATDSSTLGSDVGTQLFSRPGSLLVSGVLLFAVGLVPGLPFTPFFLVGCFAIAFALYLARHPTAGTERDILLFVPARDESKTRPLRLTSGSVGEPETSVVELTATDTPIHVTLDAQSLFPLYDRQASSFHAWWTSLSRLVSEEVGFALPAVAFSPSDAETRYTFRFTVNGIPSGGGTVPPQMVLAEVMPEGAYALGLEPKGEGHLPLYETRGVWLSDTPNTTRVLDGARISFHRPLEVIGFTIAAFLMTHPEEVVSMSIVHERLSALEKRNPGLLEQTLLQREIIDVSRLTEICRELVKHGVRIHDFRQVIEFAASYCSHHRSLLGANDDFDLEHFITFVRVAARRQRLARLLSHRGTLRIITVGEEVEEAFAAGGSFSPLAIEPTLLSRLMSSLQELVNPIRRYGIPPVALLCRSEVRAKLAQFLHVAEINMPIVTFEELEPGIELEQLTTWTTTRAA